MEVISKYDIGEVVYIPFEIESIHYNKEGCIYGVINNENISTRFMIPSAEVDKCTEKIRKLTNTVIDNFNI